MGDPSTIYRWAVGLGAAAIVFVLTRSRSPFGAVGGGPEREAIARARAAFRAAHVAVTMGAAAIVASDDDCYVVRIAHGTTRPPELAFYAVQKRSDDVALVADDAAYRPKNWR